MLDIRKARSHYKNKDLLKNQPFYNSEIKSNKKRRKKLITCILSELPFFSKKSKEPKDLTIKQLSEALPFYPSKSKKRSKRITKYQILSNVLPFFDDVGSSRRERLRRYAETYVKVMDTKSLYDSLFLAKRSINDFFKDLLEEKRGFKYILSVKVTLKKWNNATNTYDIDTFLRNSDAITVTNQKFNLNTSYETLKHRLSIYSTEGSGWIIDKIEDIWINISNYDPLVGRSYIPLLPELNNSVKGLVNLKNKDIECFKWCHFRFINPHYRNSDRIKKKG